MKPQLLFHLQTFKVLGMVGTTDLVGQHCNTHHGSPTSHIISSHILSWRLASQPWDFCFTWKCPSKTCPSMDPLPLNLPHSPSPYPFTPHEWQCPLEPPTAHLGCFQWPVQKPCFPFNVDWCACETYVRHLIAHLPISKFHAPPTWEPSDWIFRMKPTSTSWGLCLCKIQSGMLWPWQGIQVSLTDTWSKHHYHMARTSTSITNLLSQSSSVEHRQFHCGQWWTCGTSGS